MIEIPAEIRIKATIKPGAVYYFPEVSFSSPDPHYFIVLNNDPVSTNVVILVCSTSKIEKVEKRISHYGISKETIVKISKDAYACFTKDSVINCNDVRSKSIDEIIEKLESGKLKIKAKMPREIVDKLVLAVRKSPLVEQEIKNMLP